MQTNSEYLRWGKTTQDKMQEFSEKIQKVAIRFLYKNLKLWDVPLK